MLRKSGRTDGSQDARLLRCTKSLLYFLSGFLVGVGLLLYGQVKLAMTIKEEVEGTFFLWRAIGNVTYFLQGQSTQVALTVGKLPQEYLVHSKRVGLTLIALGVLCGLISPWCKKRRR